MKTMCVAFVLLTSAMGAISGDWSYSTDTDKMTGKSVGYATVRSTNSMALGFPYKGENRADIMLRTSSKNGVDILVSIDKGQMLCHSWEYACAINVKFDNKAPIRFLGIGPSDHSSNAAFLNQVPRFVAEAKKAKSILISFEVFQHGVQVMEFGPLSPLKWPPK